MMNREYYRQQGYHYIDERIEIENRLRNAQTDEEKAMLLYELAILDQKEEDWQLREDKKIRRAEERRRVEERRRQAEERQQMEEEDPRRQAEEQRRRQERIAGQPIQRLHQDFQDVTGLSFGNLRTWDRYEAMIAYYGERDLTEQQLAMMPVAQRRRLINEYMNRGTARCVASGLHKKMKGGMMPRRLEGELRAQEQLPEPSRERRPIYTRKQASDFENKKVPVPPEIVGIAGLLHTILPELVHTIYIATSLHSVGWTEEDIFFLGGNDIPALKRLIIHLSKNPTEYLKSVGTGIKGGVIPFRTDVQLESLQDQGQEQGARNFQEIEDYVIEQAEIRENYRQFARLTVAKQIEQIEEEDISFDLLQEIYRVANKPIPYELVLFYSK